MATLTTNYQKIATGSSKTFGYATGYLELWAKYNSRSIEKNTTNYSVQLRLVVTGGYIGNYQATYYSLDATGLSSSSGNLGSGDYTSRTITTVTGNVTHNDKGEKTVSFSGIFNPTAWGQALDVSGSATLPTIPRVSDVVASSPNIGDAVTITINRKSTSFTDTLSYTIGELTGVIREKTTDTVVQLDTSSIVDEIYALIPDKKEISGTITCDTYSGDTKIGTSSATFNLYAKEDVVKPSVNATVYDTNEKAREITQEELIIVEWDGVQDDRESILNYDDDDRWNAYKVSDITPNKDAFVKQLAKIKRTAMFGITQEWIADYNEVYDIDGDGDVFIIRRSTHPTAIVIKNSTEKYPQSPGLYFFNVTSYGYTMYMEIAIGQKFIKHISQPIVTINARGNKSATIKSYSINLNDGQTSDQYKYTFPTIGSEMVSVNAIDSRGYGNPKNIDLSDKMVDYVLLHIDKITLERTEEASNEIIMNLNGVWYNGDFSSTKSNTLTASYQYKATEDQGWTEGGTLLPVIDGNTFKITNLSLGTEFDYQKEYQFQVYFTDELMTIGGNVADVIVVPKGQEVMAIGEDGVWVYGKLWLNDQAVGSGGGSGSGGDTLPINSIVEYDGDTVPDGYEEIEDYSANETLIGTWLGKPLYRKVIYTNDALNANTPLNLSIGTSNIDLVFVEKSFMYNSNGTVAGGNRLCYPLPFNYAPNENSRVCLRLNLDNIELTSTGSWNTNWTKVVIVNYTKTTD